jgi:hypothetical protein
VAAGGLALPGAASGAKALLSGENAVLPWSAEIDFVAPEPAIILVTEGFA